MEEKLSVKIYNQLRREIDNGFIDDKDFLSEKQLAERFGTSKGPVKDALHLLCDQGYLVSYPRKGYMINRFTKEQVNEMQDIRRHLEKLCVRLVIENADDTQIHDLYRYTEKQFDSKDPTQMNNNLFHLKLAEISGNEYLPEVLTPLLYRASRIMQGEKSDFNKHNQIIEALLARDVEKAQMCIEEDIIRL